MLQAQQSVFISDRARGFAKLGLESAVNELQDRHWEQSDWLLAYIPEGAKDEYSPTLYDPDLALVRRILETGCDTSACIAGHTVIAAVRHESDLFASYVDDIHVATLAMDLLGLKDLTYEQGVGLGVTSAEGPWMFDAVADYQAIEAMFSHAAEYGEWPVLSEAEVLKQINLVTSDDGA